MFPGVHVRHNRCVHFLVEKDTQMSLDERRAWLESKLGRKIPRILWDELVRDRYAKAGEMDEVDEEFLLDRARFGLLMRQRNKPDAGARQRRPLPLRRFSWQAKSPDLRRE